MKKPKTKPLTLAEGEKRMKLLAKRLEEGQISEAAHDQEIRRMIDQYLAQPISKRK